MAEKAGSQDPGRKEVISSFFEQTALYRRQLGEALRKPVEISVDPVLEGSATSRGFVGERLLPSLTRVIILLADQPEYRDVFRREFIGIRIVPADPPEKPSSVYQEGFLTVRCPCVPEAAACRELLNPMPVLDNAMALTARARIQEVEQEDRAYWQRLLREAFERDVKLDVDWESFLAHPACGGNNLYPYFVREKTRKLVYAFQDLMREDEHFRNVARRHTALLRVTCAPDADSIGITREGDTIIYRCFASDDPAFPLSRAEFKLELYRLLARRDDSKLAYGRKELPACLAAVLEDEIPYSGICEIISWRFEVAEEPSPLSLDEDAVAVRVTYDYKRGTERGTFTDLQLYRWFPNGKLQRVFTRTIERTCEYAGARYHLKGVVGTSGRAAGPGLKHTRINVSLKEEIEFPEGTVRCEDEEEYAWREGCYVDTWKVFECSVSRDEILDILGVARPLHSLVGHGLRVKSFRGGIAGTLDLWGLRTVFLLRQDEVGCRLMGGTAIVDPTPPAGRFLRDATGRRTHQLGEPYLYDKDQVMDLGGFGMMIPLSCAYDAGRVVQYYRCSKGRMELAFFYNVEHRFTRGSYEAVVLPVEGERAGVPDLEVRGKLTEIQKPSEEPPESPDPVSHTPFLRTFTWNGRCYVPACRRDEGLLSGQQFLGDFSREEVLRSIYGFHFAMAREIGEDGLSVARYGDGYAVLVAPQRELFFLEPRDGELRTVAADRLPEVEYLDDAAGVSIESLILSRHQWPVGEAGTAIGVECNLRLYEELRGVSLAGRARWLFLYLHRGGERSFTLVLQAPLGRQVWPAGTGSAGRLLARLVTHREQCWKGVLRQRRRGGEEAAFNLSLTVRKGLRGRLREVFHWNGRRYIGSTLLVDFSRRLTDEMERLDLWSMEKTGPVPDDFRKCTPSNFPHWLQFILIPALSAATSPDASLPEVRGLYERAGELLDLKRAAGLRSILAGVENELSGKPEPRPEQPPASPHPAIARLQDKLVERLHAPDAG